MVKEAFEAIIGYEEIKSELVRILDQLKHPDKYECMSTTTMLGTNCHIMCLI